MRRSSESGALRLAWIVFWCLLAAFFTTRTLQRSGAAFDDLGAWLDAALWNVPSFLLWGLLSPGIEAVRRRFPFEGAKRSALYLHAALSVCVAPLHLGLLDLGFGLAERWAGHPIAPHALADSLPRLFHLDVLLYWLVALGGEALAQARRSREEQIAFARLEAQLAEARLAALRMQLHPHFLFNTLNSIAELMHVDVLAADRMLGRLSGLLETALGTASEHEVRLADELAFLERYLEVERVRFRDRLAVRFEIDPAATGRKVPALVLQPLVENAVRHGIGRLAKGGEVVVRARLHGERLTLEVENDAPGVAAAASGAPGGSIDSEANRDARSHDPVSGAKPPARSGGVGLANTAERLEQLYGARARLEAALDALRGRYLARIEIDAADEAARTASARGARRSAPWAMGDAA